jgi:hypothetical protein
MLPTLEELRAHVNRMDVDVNSLSSELQSDAQQTEVKLSELHKGVDHFAKYLGLKFERAGDNCLKMTFTHIDEHDVDKEFTFSVYVDEFSRYKVVECEPIVSGIDDALDDLNRSNDFGSFVKFMRNKFRASVPGK